MAGDIQVRVPGVLSLPAKWFGLFTTGDLLRIGTPTLTMLGLTYPPTTTGSVLAVIAGLGLGIALSTITPYGRPLDHHLVQLVRYLLEHRTVSDSPILTRNQSHFVLQDGTVLGVLAVTPLNLALQSTAEQRAVHDQWRTVLNTISYPIEVHSRQQPLDLTAYLATLQAPPAMEAVADAYTAYCSQYMGNELVTTRHFIVVRVTPTLTSVLPQLVERVRSLLAASLPQVAAKLPAGPAPSTADAAELDRRCTELQQLFADSPLTVRRVTGPQLTDLAEQWRIPQPGCTPTQVTTADAHGSGRVRRTVAVTETPSQVALAWPTDLLQVDGHVDVTQVFTPQDTAETTEALGRTLDRLEAEITSQQTQGLSGTNQYEARAADTDWMLDRLATRDDAAIQYGCYITVHAATADACETTLDTVTGQLRTQQFEYTTPLLQTDEAYRSQSPLHPDAWRQTRIMPTSSAAAGFPFATADTLNTTGVVHGTAKADQTPVIADRFQWDAAHTVRMGRTGSGKSYATKLELLRSRLAIPNVRILVVDPKAEYANLIKAIGGTVHTVPAEPALSPADLTADISCLTVPDQSTVDKADRLCDVLHTVYTAATRDDRPTLVYVDEAHTVMQDSDGRATLSTFVREARATTTGITLISQNAADFTSWREGRVILDNTPGKWFHRHERVPESVVDYFDLSNREAQALTQLATGQDTSYSEAVLTVTNTLDVTVKIHSTMPEHRLIVQSEPGGR